MSKDALHVTPITHCVCAQGERALCYARAIQIKFFKYVQIVNNITIISANYVSQYD